MIRKALDWLGSARRENEDISSDALRIACLEAANAALKAETRAANIRAMVWQVKAEDLQGKLDNMAELYAADIPLIEYARRQKANRARYDAKRRGKA
jgi:hypothetical protein